VVCFQYGRKSGFIASLGRTRFLIRGILDMQGVSGAERKKEFATQGG